MKKLLFLLLFPVISFAGITDSIGTKVSNAITKVDTSSTTKMIYNDVKDAVKSIASGLKTSVEHVMTVVAKKYFIQGIIDLVTCLLCIIGIIILYRIASKSLVAFQKDEEMLPFVGLIVPPIGIVVLACIGYSNLQEGLLYTLNPEYYVIEDIFNFIKDNYKR